MPYGEELASIRELLGQTTEELRKARAESAAIAKKLDTQNTELAEVEAKLPGFVQRSHFWLAILAVGWKFHDQDVRHREDVATDQQRDRVAGAARAFVNCEAVNRAFHGVDVGYSVLAALSHAAQDTPEGHERIDRAHEALRQGLRRTDCSGHLSTLTAAEAEQVRAESSAALPLLPLPPPPTR
jgi:hypothetical protein